MNDRIPPLFVERFAALSQPPPPYGAQPPPPPYSAPAQAPPAPPPPQPAAPAAPRLKTPEELKAVRQAFRQQAIDHMKAEVIAALDDYDGKTTFIEVNNPSAEPMRLSLDELLSVTRWLIEQGHASATVDGHVGGGPGFIRVLVGNASPVGVFGGFK